MNDYRLSNNAKADLIRIHHYGAIKFGMTQADKYFDSFFEYFISLRKDLTLLSRLIISKKVIGVAFVALIVFTIELKVIL